MVLGLWMAMASSSVAGEQGPDIVELAELDAFMSRTFEAAKRTGDPSLVACDDPTERALYVERYRILVDLDGDGVDDMLLSGSPDEFGRASGPWAVYLNRAGDFAEVGEIWAHPMAIAFEPDHARIHNNPKERWFARIWVYMRLSGRAGVLGYYRVGADTVGEMVGSEIYPGDGGTAMGNAQYEATFKNSTIPFTMQLSTTGEDGKVTWADWR